MQYLLKNEFFPEEPLMSNSCLNFKEGNNGGWIHRKLEEWMDKECITGMFQNSPSIFFTAFLYGIKVHFLSVIPFFHF